MIVDDQADVRHFLESGVAGSGPASTVIETHISFVYIYPDRVFKLKKAVKFPYLDFSTLEAWRRYCERELVLNRRTAPQLYRSVHLITQRADGKLTLDGAGDPVDAVLEMAPFEWDQLLDNIAQCGRLENLQLDRLAQQIAQFHMSLPSLKNRSGSQAVALVQSSNERALVEAGLAQAPQVRELLEQCRKHIIRFSGTFDERSAHGYIRHCHGDLHLRNICLIDDMPTLFDCLEFDEQLAKIDVLYDLAFLLMDLWKRDLPDAANRIFNRYLDLTGDTANLELMPLFMALRAIIRGHVEATRMQTKHEGSDCNIVLTGDAQCYINLARALLEPRSPRLVAIAGLSGSGKSTAAAVLAPHIGAPPGARILSTDRIRKSIFGVDPLEHLPSEAYEPDVTLKVYALQRIEARKALDGGWSVIADGVFLKQEERTAMENIARSAGVPFTGVWLQAPKEQLATRVEARRNDPSDATAQIVELQANIPVDPVGWFVIDAGQSIDQCARDISAAVSRTR
jgi:aminoglycoside phosphotransferase family enzyme/predicted kinase